MHRIPRVFVLSLLGCCFAQVSPGLDLDFARLWLCTVFPRSLSSLDWAVFMHRLPPVCVLLLTGYGFAQASPGLGLAFAELWLCIGFPWS